MDYSVLDGSELLALALRDIEKDSLDQALVKLRTAIGASNCPVAVLATLGRVHAQLELFDHARIDYEQFLERVADALHERFEYGLVLRNLGLVDAALAQWEAVLSQSRDYPPVLFQKALLCLDSGDAAEAMTHFSRLLATADASNLYVEKAKEIIRAIDETKNDTASTH